ncbi:hypothetical protein [Streptomyces sp. TRM75563]|uniref:hypothetical protein n=1 Tax=Streptomyces sp. TRM75563 TaxID=2817418 RepID=UPI001F61CF59|nr:hypothetical protein [Streptomyces sp. TRM75563]MCI4045260.1 hypothetical protein [Streptomyces sp. TRM75563]
MTALQQHLLDTCRAARLAQPAPPPPGRHDRTTLQALYRHLRPAASSPSGTTSSPSGA